MALVGPEGISALCGFEGARLPHGPRAASQLRAGTANVHGAGRRQSLLPRPAEAVAREGMAKPPKPWSADEAQPKRWNEVGRPFDGRSDGSRKRGSGSIQTQFGFR